MNKEEKHKAYRMKEELSTLTHLIRVREDANVESQVDAVYEQFVELMYALDIDPDLIIEALEGQNEQNANEWARAIKASEGY